MTGVVIAVVVISLLTVIAIAAIVFSFLKENIDIDDVDNEIADEIAKITAENERKT